MDDLLRRAEVDWIPLVIFVLWALSGLFGNKKRKQRREEEAGEIPPPRQRTEQVERGGANTELQEVLREIERDLGLSPASKTPEKPQPRAELPRGPWHAAPSPTKAGEQRSRALHRRGAMPEREKHIDLEERVHIHDDSPRLQPHEPPRSKLARSLVSDLAGGGPNLRKAILLQEILGPPVSLRDLD